MLSNFHKTTSECWQRTSGTQKSSPLSSKGGRKNIKDKKRDKRVRTESRPEEEIVKEEKFPNRSKPSHQRICGEFSNLRGQHNQEKRKTKQNKTKNKTKQKKKTQNTGLTATASREVAQTLTSITSNRGLDREAWGACLG